MTDAATRTEGWQARPWKKFQRNVYRLQQRILRQAQDRSTEPRAGATSSVSTTYNGY